MAGKVVANRDRPQAGIDPYEEDPKPGPDIIREFPSGPVSQTAHIERLG
jgi:hypothetical protein